jgi:hypothetical protein
MFYDGLVAKGGSFKGKNEKCSHNLVEDEVNTRFHLSTKTDQLSEMLCYIWNIEQ